MKVLARLEYVPLFNFSDFSVYEHCVYGKRVRKSHKRKLVQRKREKLELVRSDVCGLMPTLSLGATSYFFLPSLMMLKERYGFTPSSIRMMP